MSRSLFATGVIALAAILTPDLSQAQTFVITAQVGNTTARLSAGGTLNIAAPAIGSRTSVRIVFSYRGSTSATITGVDRTGSGDYSSTGNTLPILLRPLDEFQTTVTYNPTSGQPAQGEVAVSYIEDAGPGTTPRPTSFSILLNGTAPDLVYAYAFTGGNSQAVADGATIQFPTTTVDTLRTANFTILNRGSGPGIVSSVALSGAAFQIGGLQVPPYSINANGSLAFSVTFAPTDRTIQSGTLTINFAGHDYIFRIQGTGTSADYLYTLIRADGTAIVNIQPGQSIPFPDTNIGSNSPLSIRITNNGNAVGVIPSITAVGTAFQLTSTPFLPVNLAIGAQTQLTVAFAPATPGNLTGGLKVGDDTFNLAGTGIGPFLNYSYAIGASANTVPSGGSILFSPSRVGDLGTLTFTVTNTGNATANINSIFLTGSPAFALAGLPALPLNLATNDVARFTLRFAPTTVGVSAGTLAVGSSTFSVSGSATAPDPLPTVILTGPSSPVQPLQQPPFKLSLRTPYSIDVIGTLTLAFSSAVFVTDPAVQFASGGKTADFIIPAGSTTATFINHSDQIAIQTGTVAGTINIFPTFFTTTGVDLTPASVPVVALTVPQLAPQITGLSIANQTATGFTLSITGYATSRAISQISLTLNPAAGQTITNPTVTVSVDSAFQAWYQTASSQAAGSGFTAALPVSLNGNSTALSHPIQSVSVMLTNPQGSSVPQTVSIP